MIKVGSNQFRYRVPLLPSLIFWIDTDSDPGYSKQKGPAGFGNQTGSISHHIKATNLATSSSRYRIWNFAANTGFISIVGADHDFGCFQIDIHIRYLPTVRYHTVPSCLIPYEDCVGTSRYGNRYKLWVPTYLYPKS